MSIGALSVKITGDASQFNKTIAGVTKQLNASTKGLQTVAKSLTVVGDSMMRTISLPLLAVGVASVKMAMDFEKSMRNVNSISKLSEDEFNALGKSVIEMSKKFPQSAKELADGLYDIASSGFQGADGLKVLEAAAKAASAGMTTTAVSAKGITAVLNAYGLEADKAGEISDIMFKTVDKGVITFEELSSTVGDWVGMGKAAGLEFKELSGAIAYMTTKGISASEAGTSLQRLLTGMIKPSNDMAAAIQNAGFESGEMMLKTLGLTGTMKVLNDTTGGSITKLIELIPEIRGVRGANALLGSGYEELTKYMNDFKDTTGATDIALAEQSKSLSYQLNLLKNSATAVAIELGNMIIPHLKEFMDDLIPKIDSLAKKFGELTPEMQDNILKWGLIAIAAPAAMSFIGRAITGIIQLRTALLTMNAAMLANPLMLGGAMIAALGIYTVGIWKTTEALRAENQAIEDNNKLKEEQSITIENNNKIREGAATSMRAATQKDILLSGEAKKTMDDESEALIKLIENKSKEIDVAVKSADATVAEKIARQDHENAIKSLALRYPELTAEEVKNKVAEQELAAATEKTNDEIDIQTQSVDDLIASLYQLYNLNQSVTEATWNYDDSLKNLTDVMKKANSTEREKQTAIFATQDALENLQIAMLKEYEDTNTSIERKKELANQYIITGLKAVSSGAISEEAFASMASTFGIKSADIIAFADSMGIKLDYATRQRILDVDPKNAEIVVGSFVGTINQLLDEIERPRTVSVSLSESSKAALAKLGFGFKDGGLVGFKDGGIVSASKGINLPKFDNGGVLAMLHPPEVVLNGKEALQLVWNMATKPVKSEKSSNIIQNIYPQTSIDLTDQSNIRIIKQYVAEALNR